jgi:glycosyltransferase involved in cell wall biosynthesis
MANYDLNEIDQMLKPIELTPLPENPLVSVLTANYNYARYLREAIESVLAQSYPNFEVIVCDDGSTDASCEVVEHYALLDPRIKLLRKENGGVSSALNAAYRESKGEIVCLLDADDRFLPEKLDRIVEAFWSHPDSGFLGHKLFLIDADGQRQGRKPLFAQQPSGWYGAYVACSGDFPPGLAFGSALCLRREISDLIFPLPETFRSGADGVLMTLGPLMTPIIGIDDPLAEYRFHGRNVTNTAQVSSEFLNTESRLDSMYWELRREYLGSVDPRLGEVLPKFDQRMRTLTSAYIQARLQTASGSFATYRNLVHAEEFRIVHPALRWFWRLSIFLPRPLFLLALNEALRPGRVKQLVWRIVEVRRSLFAN